MKKTTKKTVAILTGGGDAQGLNAAIRAVTKTAHRFNYKVLGIKDGWKGILELSRPTEEGVLEPMVIELTDRMVSGILDRGGTILGSSRTNPIKIEGGLEKIVKNIAQLKIDALVAVGGEDTLSVAVKLKGLGIPVIGVPKTIDNDVGGTDYCIGFWTSVQIAMEALDRLHSTAEAHHRVMVLEVMGRHFGWIATYAGLAGGADYILIPEKTIHPDKVVESLCHRYNQGKNFSLIVVSEGAKIEEKEIASEETDSFGHRKLGGIGETLTAILREKKPKLEIRAVNLGHLLRGGTPCPFDRVMASRYGVKAVELVKKRKFGRMVALKGDRIISVPLEKALKQKAVRKDVYKVAEVFFS